MSELERGAGTASPSRARRIVRWSGLGGGPLAFVLLYLLLPESFVGADGSTLALGAPGRVTIGLMAWMAAWWMSEAIDVQATSLLPLVVLPLTGAASMEDAAAPYAAPLVFLFLGGFLLAAAMQHWGLDRRIALLTLRAVGTRPARMVGGVMIATAALSSCVSNTATAAMMLPIALSVARLFRGPGLDASEAAGLEKSLFLAVAYAATIGGLATIIGSPPNGFLAQYAASQLGTQIGFLDWLVIGLPLALTMLPLCWWLLTRVLYRLPGAELAGGSEMLRAELERLGPMRRGERLTFLVFCAAVLCWVGRPLVASFVPDLGDAGIAITAGLALFVLPIDARRGRFVLDWETAQKVPWGVLLLFGGGLSLAEAVGANGVAEFLGARTSAFAGMPPLLLTLVVTTGVIFLTELTSNTATAATLVPLFAALAPGLGLDPFALIVPATLAANCAFMLPVATPPNALVFGSGHVTIPDMCRAGLWLNLAGIALIPALTYLLVLPVLGL